MRTPEERRQDKMREFKVSFEDVGEDLSDGEPTKETEANYKRTNHESARGTQCHVLEGKKLDEL